MFHRCFEHHNSIDQNATTVSAICIYHALACGFHFVLCFFRRLEGPFTTVCLQKPNFDENETRLKTWWKEPLCSLGCISTYPVYWTRINRISEQKTNDSSRRAHETRHRESRLPHSNRGASGDENRDHDYANRCAFVTPLEVGRTSELSLYFLLQ